MLLIYFFLQNKSVPEKSESVSEKNFFFKTKMFLFIKLLQSDSVFETKVKLFSERKRFS